MMKFAMAAVVSALAATSAYAQVNIGTQAPEASAPFVLTKVTTFNLPWRIAYQPGPNGAPIGPRVTSRLRKWWVLYRHPIGKVRFEER